MSSHKPQKFNKNKSDRPPKPPGVGKRIRDTERLLKSRGATLPAEVKEAKEKELEELRGQLKGKQQQARSNKFLAKYKMVRFLERKRIMKIEAKLNKAIVTLEAKDQLNEEEKQQLKKHKEELKKASNDMAYVMHFPTHLKYISLFPKTPMTNERILKLQASIREDLMKKKEAGELKDKDATMDVTEEFPDENGAQGDKPAKTTAASSKPINANSKPAKSDNAVTKSTTAKQTIAKEQKPKGSFQRPEDAAEKAPKKPVKKEKDSFFMGDEEKEKQQEVAKKDNKKKDVKEDKKSADKMQVEPKKEKVVKKKDSDESDDSSSSDDDKSDNENQEYVKGGKSSNDDSSDDSSEDSSSEEKQPANKKRKASAADLETSKHKNKKQKK